MIEAKQKIKDLRKSRVKINEEIKKLLKEVKKEQRKHYDLHIFGYATRNITKKEYQTIKKTKGTEYDFGVEIWLYGSSGYERNYCVVAHFAKQIMFKELPRMEKTIKQIKSDWNFPDLYFTKTPIVYCKNCGRPLSPKSICERINDIWTHTRKREGYKRQISR